MATSVATAVQQTLTRLLEAADSPIAELPAGTGPDAVSVTTTNQLIVFFNEGQNLLARTPLLQLRGSASASVASGVSRVDLQGLTTSPTNRTLWRVSSATWTITSGSVLSDLDVVAIDWLETYYPRLPSTTPKHVFDSGSHVILGPTPNAAGTLAMKGLLLPKTVISGGDFDDVPDALMHHIYAFAAWRVCEQNVSNPALAAQLPVWQAEITPWTGRFLGIAGGGG